MMQDGHASNNNNNNLTISRAVVENLLNEFNYHGTTNTRKHEIQLQLYEIQNDPNSWQHSLYNLTNFSNQYVWFFNISTIEVEIIRRWNILRRNDRINIRNTCWNIYINLTNESTKIHQDKIAQLIALMGKREFPDDHPTYISQIIELIKEKFLLGIILLRATSEELVSTREDVSSERKKYFHSCFSTCLREIMELLNNSIEACLRILYKTNTLSHYFHSPIIITLPENNNFPMLTTELLLCIQNIFSWASLDEVASEQFLYNIFEMAQWNEGKYAIISVSSLTTLSELFYRQRALPLPNVIMSGIMMLLKQKNLNKTNEMYQDKLTELLRLFTTQNWSKWNNDDIFPSFLTYLYQYTFSGYGALAFTERLAIWTPIIKGLLPNGFWKYSEIFLSLVSDTLKKMQFQNDHEQELEILDNEILDDDMETEWQHFLTQCIETIALVAEGNPIGVFEQVLNAWQGPFEVFMTLEKAISDDNKILNIDDQSKCHLLHCILRDLSSLCQTLGRLSPTLQGCSDIVLDTILQITLSLIYAIKFSATKRLHTFNMLQSGLSGDFIETFAQMLSALRGLLPWSHILKNEEEMNGLIEIIAHILLPTSNLAIQEPKIITLAAAQLLLNISSIIRPKYLIENPGITKLVQINNNLLHLDKQVIIIIHQIVCNCFLLPWSNVPTNEQHFDRRIILLNDYISCLSQDLLRLDHTIGHGQEHKVYTVVVSILPILQELLDYYKESTSIVKNMIAQAYKPIITKTLSIFNSFIKTIEIGDSILNFTLSVMRTLQIQLGSEYIKEMLGVFLEASTREQLTIARFKSMDKLLQMLLLVVEQPGNASLNLLPAILNLALEHVVPLLNADKNALDFSDVAYSLYSLFDGILQHRWQYFYKSQVLRGFSPGASDTMCAPDEPPQNADKLLLILTQYGRALVCGNDPHITRRVLTSLQALNDRWKLYYKEFFKQNLLSSFQNALIKALISIESTLHYDLLISALFTMGQVNIKMLHETFVDIGYPRNLKAIENICLTTDLPTFSNYITQLIQDTRCHQLSAQ